MRCRLTERSTRVHSVLVAQPSRVTSPGRVPACLLTRGMEAAGPLPVCTVGVVPSGGAAEPTFSEPGISEEFLRLAVLFMLPVPQPLRVWVILGGRDYLGSN